MIDLLLDDKHDLVLDARLVAGIERVRQQVKVTLLTFLGEWFLDTGFGVPVLDKILVKSPRRAEVEAIIRAKIRDVPGVKSVPRVDVRIDHQTRRAEIVLGGIETEYGQISVKVQHG